MSRLQLQKMGIEIDQFKVSDAVDLVSNGIITNEKTLQEDPELVQAVVSATLKGMNYTIQHPDEAFEISKKYVENLAEGDAELQMEILNRSIAQWQAERIGYSDPRDGKICNASCCRWVSSRRSSISTRRMTPLHTVRSMFEREFS
jgi:NitT/TauT family transport system substrate-binding protein